MVTKDNSPFVSLKSKLVSRTPTIGTFVKSDSYQQIEILSETGFDFLVLDAEHAPWGRAQLDAGIMAARLSGIPVLVRVPNSASDTLLSVLDMGATGVLVPHVASVDVAENVSRAAHYLTGSRGLSGSVRAAGYGAKSLAEYARRADDEVCIICQLEDLDAMDAAGEILATQGIDGGFIGPADLSAAFGVFDPTDTRVTQAIELIAGAATRQNRCMGIYINNAEQARRALRLGISSFVVGSDQMMLKNAARQTVAEVRESVT